MKIEQSWRYYLKEIDRKDLVRCIEIAEQSENVSLAMKERISDLKISLLHPLSDQ